MDDVMNVVALLGAAFVMVGGGLAYVSIEEAIERRTRRKEARALEPRILFRVGSGPPSPAEWAARQAAEADRFGLPGLTPPGSPRSV